MELKVDNLSKEFKDDVVLDHCSCIFKEGNIYGLVGRNGSGKSVFLKVLCGFYKPSSGEITLDGYNYIAHHEFPKDTRALIEKSTFLADLSGYENLKLLASIQNRISDEEIIETLKQVDLLKYKDKKFHTYSLGMKQKLGIAQVLMENPQIMIFDEPFNGIDENSVDSLRRLFLKKKQEGHLIIISSHIKEDIEYLADIIYQFDDGKMIQNK